jgi:hypothetical protein
MAAETWPIAFDGHAGWLHAPSEGRAGAVGVVICAPLGRDARCAHRPLRLLAEQLAAAGVCTLRYDHLGTGDSLDLPEPDGDALPVWREGLAAAIEKLKALTGVQRVVVAGLRFGAALAVEERDRADGLVLLAPVLRGRTWLRELSLLTSVMAPSTGGANTAGGLDADGLVLSAATVASLSDLNLTGVDLVRRSVLVAAQNGATQAFAETVGAHVASFDGFDALFEDSHSNRAPEAVFRAVTDWTVTMFAQALAQPLVVTPPDPAEARLYPPGAVETPVLFGNGLRGVLCGPVDGAARISTALALGNTGGDPRAGIGGFATATARAMAAGGGLSLRFDFAGLGDSLVNDDAATGHIYLTPRGDDFDAARAVLVAAGAGAVIAGGVCSGGHHAVKTVLNRPGFAGAFTVNTVVLTWRKGNSLALGERDQGRSTQAYMKLAGDPDAWRRLLRGGLDVRAVARTLMLRLKARLAARSAHAPENAVKAALAAMSARGGRLRWVVGAEDIALDILETHFGRGGRRMAALPGAQVRIIEGLDHGLALSASRDKARAELLAFVAEVEAR